MTTTMTKTRTLRTTVTASPNATVCNNVWSLLSETESRRFRQLECGKSNYIDYLQLEELNQPVVVGRDEAERKYIAAKIRVSTYRRGQVEHKSDSVLVFHQRYEGREDLWIGCGPEGPRFSPANMPLIDMLSFSQLLQGKNSTISIVPNDESHRIYVVELIY